jgi:hypothetical protein
MLGKQATSSTCCAAAAAASQEHALPRIAFHKHYPQLSDHHTNRMIVYMCVLEGNVPNTKCKAWHVLPPSNQRCGAGALLCTSQETVGYSSAAVTQLDSHLHASSTQESQLLKHSVL